MTDAAFGEDTRMRMEALRRQLRLSPRAFVPDLAEGVSIRQLRGATEYRGRRDRLVASDTSSPNGCRPSACPDSARAQRCVRATADATCSRDASTMDGSACS